MQSQRGSGRFGRYTDIVFQWSSRGKVVLSSDRESQMTFFTTGQLDIVMDAVSVCFFGITVILLIIMAIKFGRISPKYLAPVKTEGFKEELVQVIKDAEKWNENDRTSDEKRTGPYKNVEKWANSGLSAGDISKKANIPKSEVELILRLKKIGVESRMKNSESKIETRVK